MEQSAPTPSARGLHCSTNASNPRSKSSTLLDADRDEEKNLQKGFTFQTTKSVLAEPAASARIGELVRSLGCRSIFLVTDIGAPAHLATDGVVKCT